MDDMDSKEVDGTRSESPQDLMRWAKAYITIAGVLGILTGLLGFTDNPFVGDSGDGSIFATDGLHNAVHIATGLLALWIGLAMTGKRLAQGIMSFGILYIVLFGVFLGSPTLLGLMDVSVNKADHVLHAALGVTTFIVGLAAVRRAAGPRAPNA